MLAYASAAVLALAIGRDLLHMPLQVADSLTLVLDAAQPERTVWSEFRSRLSDTDYLRPVYYATIKLVSDLGNGHYFLAYRLFHALLVFAFLMLFVRALEVRDWLRCAVMPLALAVFLGIHTFLGTVKEIWPISHFLQVAVLSLAALNLTQMRRGLLVDIAIMVTFVLAAFTLESGLLVWVVVVGAWISGMPGASSRTVIGVTLLVGSYALLRFAIYDTTMPGIEQRSTGFLLEVLDPPEVRERFGDNLWPLYGYNVFSSVSSVLFTEPRAGVWQLVRAIRGDQLAPRYFIQTGASLLATGLVIAYVVDRLRSGVRRPVTLADRHTVIFAMVLGANAAICYLYTKDEILSVAGAFYALPVFGATVHFIRRWSERPRRWQATAAVCVLLVVGGAAWAIRAAGVHHVLRSQAFVQRNDWARMERQWRRDGNWEQYSESVPLILQLRDEAISMQVVNPYFVPRWMERVFDIHY